MAKLSKLNMNEVFKDLNIYDYQHGKPSRQYDYDPNASPRTPRGELVEIPKNWNPLKKRTSDISHQ